MGTKTRTNAILLIVLIMTHIAAFGRQEKQEMLSYGRFGKLTMYHPTGQPGALVLFVSGDGGWQHGVINMARYLAMQGALVAGIDAKIYKTALASQKSGCLYPAADFEQLSMMLQKKYQFKDYQKPLLVGYSYGATLVYGLLAQAPAGTFLGGIALGFSPDLELPRMLCSGSGLSSHAWKAKNTYYLDPVKALTSPLFVLNGVKDEVCDYQATAEFLKGMEQAELVSLPLVGHGFSIADHWLPQFKNTYQKITGMTAVKNKPTNHPWNIQTTLPIYVLPSKESRESKLLFLLSGDGGWTSFDQGLAAAYVKKGFTVIGLDAQKYFWQKRSPEEATSAISNILTQYTRQHPQASISLMGYSFGACVIPFIANRLRGQLKESLKEVILLSPDVSGDFEIHVADMLSFGRGRAPYDVVAEFKKTAGVRRICLFGDTEDATIAQAFKRIGVPVDILPGGHHYNNDFNEIVDRTLNSR
ncbi:virulence factor [Sphingobacterium oryzagri]|uniref:Virulence factor n=1 Tax=Sphingobacterium oryzagri TaxID=3025669 RepID=A0ABY7WP78_9SPHI|nr:AcvB/VirJ family lysyl-phosphatidylglycerol hydrolase [Sphingobacterium sp. KACC 22765]WDF70527.1 virulence factor [Sphingobacterium sp. KACC 22765]